ncbi:MAG: phosphatase PAP2 family protein [Prevotella sp.]|nr:phosphatase PAP2 family protein [Prevotella sp.]
MISFYCIYFIIIWAVFMAVKPTRKFMLALVPWLLFVIIYNLLRYFPNYEANPVDIRGIYEAEKALFGVTTAEGRITLGEYFNVHNAPAADLLSGLFYLCWIPVPMIYSICLFFSGKRRESLKASTAFLVVNIIGFAVYYIHPAAPPWYVLQYGFTPQFDVPGNVAGLVRFDNLLPFDVFAHIYPGNSNIFAAVPSLHSAYVLTAAVYVLINKGSKALFAAFMVITVGIWCTAVYTCHHYVIDVLLGIADAAAGIILLECVLYRIPAVKRAFDKYVALLN